MRLVGDRWTSALKFEDQGEADFRPLLTCEEAESYVAQTAFAPSSKGRVGLELEWLVYDICERSRSVTAGEVLRAVACSETSGRLSTEPGGQLELSSIPTSLADCIEWSKADMESLRDCLLEARLELVGLGMDPLRPPMLQLDSPRYNAMLELFDMENDAGRRMLCSTASVQVSVDAAQHDGSTADFRTKWQAAYAIGPVLVAAFANSPIANGRVTGWRSTRQATWMQIDRSRTRTPDTTKDPSIAWARYALDAQVICIRRRKGQPWTAPPGLTFRQWVVSGVPRRPTLGDLRYHLSTLFPPIRPRGYLELRMIDAPDGDKRIVTVAVVGALLGDSKSLDTVMAIAEPVMAVDSDVNLWTVAARNGVDNNILGRAAIECFDAALSALGKLDGGGSLKAIVDNFAEKYASRRRCPADDLVERIDV